MENADRNLGNETFGHVISVLQLQTALSSDVRAWCLECQTQTDEAG